MKKYRVEKDTLGTVKVPQDCYFGAQTQRAVENFPISGVRLQECFIRAQAVIKKAAAMANMECGVLDEKIGAALIKAADEVMAGRFKDEFVVDVFQAGAGTSQNMNMNEVLANRAEEILGGKKGEYKCVHPNDHANMSQSTNDTIHAAIHIAAVGETEEKLFPAMQLLEATLDRKTRAFEDVIKCGRTHLQDAVPIELGQVFGAYTAMIRRGRKRAARALEELKELCIGGTAVGTGLNTPPGYREHVILNINETTGRNFKGAPDMIEAMQSFDIVVDFAGGLRTVATSLKKIADDFRLMGSGPRTGLGEIELPTVQPGSSIMPGKVNPVLAEMLNMTAYHAMGCDTAIVLASQAGQLELNVMMPVIAYNLIQEIQILSSGMEAFARKCVRGVKANEETCRVYANRSAALATALNPALGYQRAAELSKEALKKNLLIRDLVIEKKLLPKKELDDLLDLRKMTGSGAAEREGFRGAKGGGSGARRGKSGGAAARRRESPGTRTTRARSGGAKTNRPKARKKTGTRKKS